MLLYAEVSWFCVISILFARSSADKVRNNNIQRDDRNRKENAPTDERIVLDIHNHQPCNSRKSSNEQVRFGNSTIAPFRATESDPNCYEVKSKVEVYEEVDADMEVYFEMKDRVDSNRPMPCKDAVDGCGSIGSCVMCQSCESDADAYSNLLKRTQAAIYIDGVKARCGDRLTKGVHDNISLRFCMPSRNELVESLGEEEGYDRIAKLGELFPRGKKKLLVGRIYMFDFPIRRIYNRQVVVEKYRLNRLPKDETTLSDEVYENLPFNRFIKDNKMFVACHSFSGTTFIQEEEIPVG
jgi:hypothetical protein